MEAVNQPLVQQWDFDTVLQLYAWLGMEADQGSHMTATALWAIPDSN